MRYVGLVIGCVLLSLSLAGEFSSCQLLSGPTQVTPLDTVSNDLTLTPDSGVIYDPVLVQGLGLATTTSKLKVFFGENEAYIDSIGPKGVVVRVPPIDTGYYAVRIFQGNDTIRSSSRKFHVYLVPVKPGVGITVEISLLKLHEAGHGSGPNNRSYDTIVESNYSNWVTGTVTSNNAALFSVDTIEKPNNVFDDHGKVFFGNGTAVSRITISTRYLVLGEDNTVHNSDLVLVNLPNYVQNKDGSKTITVQGQQIMKCIAQLNEFSQSPGQYYPPSVSSIDSALGCSNNSVMTVKIQP